MNLVAGNNFLSSESRAEMDKAILEAIPSPDAPGVLACLLHNPQGETHVRWEIEKIRSEKALPFS